MKDTKKKIEFFTFYDKTGIEAHLTGMAESSSFLKISINEPFPLTSFRSEGEKSYCFSQISILPNNRPQGSRSSSQPHTPYKPPLDFPNHPNKST